jgi:hypothetical protein
VPAWLDLINDNWKGSLNLQVLNPFPFRSNRIILLPIGRENAVSVKVFVWNPSVKDEAAYGHASMYVGFNTASPLYISWWPVETPFPVISLKESDVCAPAYGTQKTKFRTYEDDCLDEGRRKEKKPRKPEFERVINGLDDAAIKAYWNSIVDKNEPWCGRGLNCAVVVYNALVAGGGDPLSSPPEGEHAPQKLKSYVVKLMRNQEKNPTKSKQVLNNK